MGSWRGSFLKVESGFNDGRLADYHYDDGYDGFPPRSMAAYMQDVAYLSPCCM